MPSLDHEWDRLKSQIELSESFWLGFIFCSSPLDVAVLHRRAGSLLEQAGKRMVSRNIKEIAQVSPLLPWLLDDREPAQAGCTWIETGRADVVIAADQPWTRAWDTLFLRANERRDVLRARLQGGLVFALPPHQKPRVREAAPDLWSVRALVLDVEPRAEPPPEERTVQKQAGELLRQALAESSLEDDMNALAAANVVKDVTQVRPRLPIETENLDAEFAQVEADRHRGPGAEAGRGRALLRAAAARLGEGRVLEAAKGAEEAWALLREGNILDATRALWLLGNTKQAQGRLAEALEDIASAVERRRAAVPEEVPINWEDMAGRLAIEQGDVARALRIYAAAEASYRGQLKTKASLGNLRGLLISVLGRGEALQARGDLRGALKAFEEAVDLARRIRDQHGASRETLEALSMGFVKLGDVREALGDFVGAAAAVEEAVKLDREARSLDEGAPAALRALSISLNRLGAIRTKTGDLDEAMTAFEEALALRRRSLEKGATAEAYRDVASSLRKIGGLRARRKERAAARATLVEALEVALAWRERLGDSPGLFKDVAISVLQLAEIARTYPDHAETARRYLHRKVG